MTNEKPFATGWAGRRHVVAAALGGLLMACLVLAHTAKAAPVLPDGRAYEQVSPVDKNGNNIQASTDIVQAAAQGARVTYFVGGGIPGGNNSTDLPIYMGSRGAAGWNTIGLSPPPSTGPRGYVAGWSGDLLNVFSTNFQFEGPLNVQLYDLDTQSNAFSVLTGNRSPQAKFVGASANEQVAAFEDPFAEEALYVTDRASGVTVTASKLNNGLPVEFAVAGPYNWNESPAGLFGGANGHFYTAAENALSADGSTLYMSEAFEPNQLYVRRNLFAPQSPLDGAEQCENTNDACTIKVSTSQASTPDPNGEKPAAFVGATPDGSKALFMSSGKLTDDANTGPTDEGTDLYLFTLAPECLKTSRSILGTLMEPEWSGCSVTAAICRMSTSLRTE